MMKANNIFLKALNLFTVDEHQAVRFRGPDRRHERDAAQRAHCCRFDLDRGAVRGDRSVGMVGQPTDFVRAFLGCINADIVPSAERSSNFRRQRFLEATHVSIASSLISHRSSMSGEVERRRNDFKVFLLTFT